MDLHSLPLDYGTLRIIWWVLLGVLLIGLAIMDGFDFGVATLLPFVAKNDTERRIVINTVGPFWEGNQVWLILGGGAVFAAWPAIYAVSFSGLYLAMFVILAALILRPVGFKFRSKVENPSWRKTWDVCLFLGGCVPALLFGVAVGNVILGVPFHFDETLRLTYTGTFFELLSPFALVCGGISLTMCMRHGGIYLALKTEDTVQNRLKKWMWSITMLHLLFLGLGWWLSYKSGPSYHMPLNIDWAQPSNPLNKVVDVRSDFGVNFSHYPWMLVAPLLAFGGIILSEILFAFRLMGASFIFSGLSIFGIVSIPGLALFPMILPSSSHPNHSLTLVDASSSHLTLFVMFIAALIFVPIILGYTAWVYRMLRGKVTTETIHNHQRDYY